MELSGRKKAAVLLSVLPTDTAGRIMQELTENEQQELAHEIARLDAISADRRRAVVREFRDRLSNNQSSVAGGEQAARSILSEAFDDNRAEAILRSMDDDALFDFANTINEKQLTQTLRSEHPQVIVAILSCVSSSVASAVLDELDEPLRSTVARRVAVMQRVDPEALKDAEDRLRESVEAFANSQYTQAGGVDVLVDMLNQADRGMREQLLDELGTDDPELAESLREELFTFRDLLGLPDRTLQTILQDVERDTLVLALKGLGEDRQKRVYDNMSERAASLAREEVEYAGTVAKQDVDEARRALVEQARALDERGEITIVRSDDDYIE